MTPQDENLQTTPGNFIHLRNFFNEDNAELYGTKWLLPPSYDGSGRASTPSKAVYMRLLNDTKRR